LPDNNPRLSFAEARAESERCLYCVDAPCIKACPTEIDIPTFIKKIASGNVAGSAKTIFAQNILGYSCARVCPVEVLCEGSCVYTGWQKAPISIGRLQRYATEHHNDPDLLTKKTTASPKKIACVGAGPASLACAAYLALEGHAVTIFEKGSLPGGLNTTGIAPYKLHAEDALHEVEFVKSLGVKIQANTEVGKTLFSDDMDFDAVFIGVGLGTDTKLGIPGEDGSDVFGATAWIETMKLARNGGAPNLGNVLVIGGGNTAIDVARECAQLDPNANVTMVYRRGKADMSGYGHELEGAKKESVRFVTHARPVKVVRDASGRVKALRVALRVEHGDAANVTNELDLPCDRVIVAIGQSKLREIASQFAGVELDARGCVVANAKTGATGNPKVYSGGDCVNGGTEVVNAVAEGRNAARAMVATWDANVKSNGANAHG
jgi:dihydropyrimidine dehydrogenase (NAD+) subunit PreT